MFYSLYKMSPLVAALALAACGGGEDNANSTNVTTSTNITISTDNQQAVATEVASNAIQFANSTLASANVSVVSAASLSKRAASVALMAQATETATTRDGISIGVGAPQNCVGGGTATANYGDTNSNNEWDNNESGTLVFTNCVIEAGVVFNGSMARTYSKTVILGSGGSTTQTTKLTPTSLKISVNGVATELVSGQINVVTTTTSTSQSDNYKTTALKVKVTQNSKVANFTVEEDVNVIRSPLTAATKTVTGSGKITADNAKINGYVSFTISESEPMVISTTEPISVTSGQLVITGSRQTALYISFGTPSAQQVTLQLKQDGANVGFGKIVDVGVLIQQASTAAQ